MKRDVAVYLNDIADSINKIEQYCHGITEQDFKEDDEKKDAICRRLIIIGEAVKFVPSEMRIKYPQVPWRSIAGARDILTHQYFEISDSMLWKVIQIDLPILKNEISTILNDIG